MARQDESKPNLPSSGTSGHWFHQLLWALVSTEQRTNSDRFCHSLRGVANQTRRVVACQSNNPAKPTYQTSRRACSETGTLVQRSYIHIPDGGQRALRLLRQAESCPCSSDPITIWKQFLLLLFSISFLSASGSLYSSMDSSAFCGSCSFFFFDHVVTTTVIVCPRGLFLSTFSWHRKIGIPLWWSSLFGKTETPRPAPPPCQLSPVNSKFTMF